MCLARFKNQKFSSPEKGDIPSPGPHPLQPWLFVPWHIPSMLLMFLILPFYPELCMVSTTTKALKSGLKMHLARFKIENFPTQGKGTSLHLDPHPMQPQPFLPRHLLDVFLFQPLSYLL